MNWENKSWEVEDKEFAPKRRVNNKGAEKKPHMIGSFYSNKVGKIVEFESSNEEIVYYLFELDNATIRYYAQPVKIEIPYLDECGNRKNWKHVSDVLAFRQGSPPHLFQIKDILDNENEKLKNCNINEACISYAQKHNWQYSVIRPKQLPKDILHNIKFLIGFINERDGYEEIIPELVSGLSFVGKTSINDLAKNAGKDTNPLFYLPAIYHLIAKGIFKININNSIGVSSEITIASHEGILDTLLKGGMLYEMEKH